MAGNSAIGLDIGTSAVRAAQVTVGKNGARVERIGQVALPLGAVRQGEVADVAAVANAVKSLWSQLKLRGKSVVVGVANQRVVVRQLDLPGVDLADLRASLQFLVQDFIPMPVDQAILDVHPIEQFVDDDGHPKLRVLLVAASREMVNSALDAVREAGLKPVGVDLTPFAVLRALGAPDPLGLSSDAEALVEIGASVTNIVVHSGGVPRFVRVLIMGGDDITEALADRIGVSLEQAEAVKQTHGLSAPGTFAELDQVQRVIDSTAASFVEEIRGSLDYYSTQAGGARLRRVVLAGGGAQLVNLAERLTAALRLPVDRATPLGARSLGKTGLTDEQLSYLDPLSAVPVGLALGMAS